jgi:PAS domain S-box-containing protein
LQYESILMQYKEILDVSSIFSKSDIQGRITYVNDTFCKVSQYTKDELIGQPHSIVKDPNTPKVVFKELWETIASGKIWKGILKNRKKDGTFYYVNSSIYPIKNEEGKIVEYISLREDITELIKSQELLKIYSTEIMTNLPNRQKLNEKLIASTTEMMSILLDVKELSIINELYGEEVGNKILLETSLKLKNCITNDSVVLYKLDADRYLILIDDKTLFSKYESLIQFTLLSEEEFITDDIVVNFNIGVAYGCKELLNRASLALKEAKKNRSRLFVYNDCIDTKEIHIENLKKFNNFKDALLNNRIEPFFQPIVDANTEKIVKYEALARIIDADANVIAVEEFMEIAQKSSFFDNFTRQIIQKIFAISKNSNKQVTINLTYENINSKELVAYIEHRLKKHDGPSITFELLESEDISDYTVLENFIKMVKSYGSFIAIDDFGTGYSNFTHLTKFQADFIKIDGSIISKILSDANCKSLVQVLVDYAKRNNMKTIAEYVSSPEIAIAVKELGVDLLQGYHYGKAENTAFYNLTS